MPRVHHFEASSAARAALVVGGGPAGLAVSTRIEDDAPQHYGHAVALHGEDQVTVYTDVDEPWQVRWASAPTRLAEADAEPWVSSQARAALVAWSAASGLGLSEAALKLLGALPPDQYTLIHLKQAMTRPATVFEEGEPRARADAALVAAAVEQGEEQDLLVTVEATVRPGTGFQQLLLGMAVMDYPYDEPERAHLLLIGLGAPCDAPLAVVPRAGALVIPCSGGAARQGHQGREAASVGEDWLDRKHAGVIEALAAP